MHHNCIYCIFATQFLPVKKAFSILMVVILLFPSLSRIGILIDFKINQDFIAEVLCINKEEPMTVCNGKCYLSSQLKKGIEQEEKQAPPAKKETLNLVYCIPKLSVFISDLSPLDFLELKPFLKADFYGEGFLTSIFRPPIF